MANISEEFTTNYVNVTVVLEPHVEDTLLYSIDATATVDMGDTSIQLRVPYNEQHNLSIKASLCGDKAISIYRLFYGKLQFTDLICIIL